MVNEAGETQQAFDDGVSVLVSVDAEGILMHKIGTSEMVRDAHRIWSKKWVAALGKLYVIDLPLDTSVDELNRIFHSVDYIGRFLKLHGIELDYA
jgi:hypothetical protein